MMLSETQFLSQSCENCGSTEYMEHDSGFYVCVNCAVVSQMRHGLALDYKDLNTKGMKFKRKNIEDAEEDDQVDLNNFETNMNTVNNTCANSEYNDSVTSRLTKHDNSTENRPLSEVLLDHQIIFFKIFRSLFFLQYMKKRNFVEAQLERELSKQLGELNKFESCENLFVEHNLDSIKNNKNNKNFIANFNQFDSEAEENRNVKNIENDLKQKPKCNEDLSYYRHLQKQFYENLLSREPSDKDQLKGFSGCGGAKDLLEQEAAENYERLLNFAKEKWMLFIKSEYENQIKKRGPNFRKRGMRSRRNTEDEFSHLNTIASHQANQLQSNHNTNNPLQNINSSNLNLQYNNNNNNNLIHINHSNNFNANSTNSTRVPQRDKRSSLNEELKSRKIKSKNIIQLEAYKNTRLRNKEKKRKFIEEHDQVLSMLKKAHEYIKNKTGISVEDTVSFKNMLVLADLFGIRVSENASYEDLIHAFFIAKELNYRNLYSEKTFDENKSNLTSDNFLSLIYECFSNKINSFNKDFPILIYELISVFKKFNFNLHLQEIKFLKFLSKEKLLKLLLEKTKMLSQPGLNQSALVLGNIQYLSGKLLKMPLHFEEFARSVFKISEFSINKNLTHIYNYEAFSVAIVIISMRFFYGFNDLPYFVEIQKAVRRGVSPQLRVFEENKKLKEIFSLFNEIADKDKVYALYAEMPSVIEIIENLFSLIKEDESSSSLWDGSEFKKHLTLKYKNKYVDYNNLCLFPKLENSSCVRNINELEKKIESKIDKIISAKIDKGAGNMGCSAGARKISLIYRKHSNDGNYDIYPLGDNQDVDVNNNKKEIEKDCLNDCNRRNHIKKDSSDIKIKFSEKFKNKLKSKNKQIKFEGENEIENFTNNKANKTNIISNNSKTNTNKKLNKFLKEEIDFYKMVAKKNKKNKKIAIPLPCDTIVRYNKKAFKFEGVIPPTTELMIYYLFSRYFKIEVQVLRKCIKILDKVIEENFK